MTTTKQARHSRIQRGSGIFTCRSCGHKTRDTGDNGQVELCSACFELAGLDNLRQDRNVDELLGRYGNDLRSYLAQLTSQVGQARATSAFPELYALVQPAEAPAAPVAAPAAPAAPTRKERAEKLEAELAKPEWFVHVGGIEEDPEFVLIVQAPNTKQACRVAKRLVEKERSIDGLTFRAEEA